MCKRLLNNNINVKQEYYINSHAYQSNIADFEIICEFKQNVEITPKPPEEPQVTDKRYQIHAILFLLLMCVSRKKTNELNEIVIRFYVTHQAYLSFIYFRVEIQVEL